MEGRRNANKAGSGTVRVARAAGAVGHQGLSFEVLRSEEKGVVSYQMLGKC